MSALCKIIPLEDALNNVYRGDRYLFGYAVEGEDKMPRLSAPAMARLALANAAEEDLIWAQTKLEVALIDLDGPNHEPPSQEWVDTTIERIPAWMNAGWYRTPNGLRVVVLPKEKVPIMLADSYLDWICNHLKAAGIEVDPTTAQCLRMQRAPHALSRDMPEDYTRLDLCSKHPAEDDLELRDAHLFGEVVQYGTQIQTHMPSTWSKTDFKPIKKALGDLRSEKVRTGTLRIPKGKRHGELVALAVSIAEALATNDPADVYARLYRVAELNFQNEPGRNWQAELAGICKWGTAWAVGKVEQVEKEKEEAVEDLAERMKVNERDIPRSLVVSHGSTTHFLCEDTGRYDMSVANKDEVLAALAQASPRLGWPIAITNPSKAQIIRDHGVIAENVVYSYTPRYPQYDKNERTLYVDAVTICDDVYPEYNKDIAAWLQHLAGDTETFGHLNQWLACYPVLDEPACALYIHGSAGMGKQMLALGLARIHSKSKEFVKFKDMTGNFQEKLRKSCLIWGDEEAADSGGKTNSHVFREMVGNDGQQVNEKYRSKVSLDGYPRLLVTANNDDAFKIREDLERSDLEAIEIRIGYIHAAADTNEFLAELAQKRGFSTSKEMTKAWVDGAGIARHVLWLRDNFKYQRGNRLIVEGWKSEWTKNLGLRVGWATSVCCTAAKALLSGNRTDAVRAMDGYVYVNGPLLMEEWEQYQIKNSRVPANIDTLNRALTMLAHNTSERLDSIRGRGKGGQKRYHRIPIDSVAKIADKYQVASEEEIRTLGMRTREAEKSHGKSTTNEEVAFDMAQLSS